MKRSHKFEGPDWNVVLFENAALDYIGSVKDTAWFLKQIRAEGKKGLRDLFATLDLMSCELLCYGFECVQSPAHYNYTRLKYVLDKDGKTDSELTITPSSFDRIEGWGREGWGVVHPYKSLKWLSAPKITSKLDSKWVEEKDWLSTKKLMREWMKPKDDFTCYPRLDAFYDKAIALMANVWYDLTQIVRVLRKRRKWGTVHLIRYGLFFPDECLRAWFFILDDETKEWKWVLKPVDFVLPVKPMEHNPLLQ